MNVFIANINGDRAVLITEESWHCARVLRKKTGDKIHLIDGKGHSFEAELSFVSEKKCEAKILSGPVEQKKHPYFLHLAIAPTKQIDRIEWMVEKCVEIGIDEISFIQCKNSERVNVKTERILKIVESAVKQSLQAYIPKVNELTPFNKFVQDGTGDIKLIAHCEKAEKKVFKSFDIKNKSILILIGPEGDFSPDEIQLAIKNNFEALSLGENRLRTETAGLYVTQALSILTKF